MRKSKDYSGDRMSNFIEGVEGDIDYLLAKSGENGLKPTENQIDQFTGQVSLMVVDGHVDEAKARELTFKALIGHD